MIGENWLKVAMTAMALGVGLYLIPLGMIANPDIIRLVESPILAIIAMLRLAVGLALVSYGLISERMVLKTAMLVSAGMAVIFSGIYF